MREIPSALQSHLSGGVTTLCTCWKVIRRDGQTLCCTDHDRDVTIESHVYRAASGVEGASAEMMLGFAAGGTEIQGALIADALREEDLLEGRYDGAMIEIWRVNWADPAQKILLDIFYLGEIRRNAEAFTAELRSMSTLFDQENGRLYQSLCSATLGDARCGVDMTSGARSVITTIARCVAALEIWTPDAPFPERALANGVFEVLDGPLSGVVRAIERHRVIGGQSYVRLWRPLADDLDPGTQVRLMMGCDKAFATCRDKFGNQERFRGFPHIPGNDALLAHVGASSTKLDGGSLFR